MKILSLFANIGVAEAYLREIGVEVSVANELIERRAKLYSAIYPETKMIAGDITNDAVCITDNKCCKGRNGGLHNGNTTVPRNEYSRAA